MQSGLQPLIEDEDRLQVTRWATLYCGATVVKNQLTTLYEKRMALLLDITKSKPFVFIKEEYGVSKSVHHRYTKQLLKIAGCETAKELRKQFESGKINRAKLRELIDLVKIPKMGRPTILLPDEETLLVAAAEMSGVASQPSTRKSLSRKLSEVKSLVKKNNRDILQKSKLKYAYRVIRRVNAREPESDNQKKRSKTGEIKVAGLSHRRAKQSDPRKAWTMYHRIVHMYREGKKIEDAYFDSLVNGYKEDMENLILGPKECRKVNETIITSDSDEEVQMLKTIITSDSDCLEKNTATTTTTNENCSPPSTKTEMKTTVLTKTNAVTKNTTTEGTRTKPIRIETTEEEAEMSLEKLTEIPDDVAKVEPRPDQIWNCDEIGIDPNGK